MAQIMEAESINQELMAGLAALFPGASAYMLDLLSYIGVFENLDTLKAAVLNIKQQIDLPQDINADDLIISILLFEQSPLAARRKVEVLKAKKAVAEISAALALDKQYIELLLNHYAALASKTLFIQEYETLCKDLPLDLTKQNPKFAAVIDTLIDQAQKQEAKTSIILQENAAFIEMLSKENGLSGLLTKNLIEIYCQNGAVALKPLFEPVLKELNKINGNKFLNTSLAAKVFEYKITEEDAKTITSLAKTLPYPILEEDLQLIAFKYLKFKTPAEIAQTLDAVLKRLPFADDPVENLGLALNVLTNAKAETLNAAQLAAKERRGKVLFMRSLSTYKPFNGYEDELTAKFYGQNTLDELIAYFNHLLKGLPHSQNINENTDIAIKVLLRKLPPKDATSQAVYRKENKRHLGATALEKEALESYLGTKSKEDILALFHSRLAPYDFWKNNEEKHCFILSMIVGELNGSTSANSVNLALALLAKDYPEESVEIILSGLPDEKMLDTAAVINAYEKFFANSKDHPDSARRTVNMLQ